MDLTEGHRKALRKLAGFAEPMPESRITGVAPAERAKVLEDLAHQGLVEAIPPAGRIKKPRYRLTSQGRGVAASLPEEPPKARGRTAVTSLAAKVDDLAVRLGRLEAQVAQLIGGRGDGPPGAQAAGPIVAPATMTYEAFRSAARDAHRRLDQAGRTLGLVPVPDLRRAMGDGLSHQAFDEYLLRLHRDGAVHLMPHDHPASLPEDRRRDSLQHPTAGLLYFVRWLEP